MKRFLKRLGNWMEAPIGKKHGPTLFEPTYGRKKHYFPFVFRSTHEQELYELDLRVEDTKFNRERESTKFNTEMGVLLSKLMRIRMDEHSDGQIGCTVMVDMRMIQQFGPEDARYLDHTAEYLKRNILRELEHYIHTGRVQQVERIRYEDVNPNDFGGVYRGRNY